jgi:hypothetical protein
MTMMTELAPVVNYDAELINIGQCSSLSGLGSKEMVLGVTPSAVHQRLYESYIVNIERGWEAVRDMIVFDIRFSLDLGARKRAADLLIVLRRFLTEQSTTNIMRRTVEIVAIAPNVRAKHASRIDVPPQASRICGLARRSFQNPRTPRGVRQLHQDLPSAPLVLRQGCFDTATSH